MREIGSEFWYEDDLENGDNYFNKFANAQYVFCGRTALDYILQDLITQKKILNILLPSYLCASIISVVRKNGLNIYFYYIKINKNKFDADLEINNINHTAIYICDYFFFDNDYYRKIIKFAKKYNLPIIHDITHSLLSDDLCVEYDDYYFASLRKWFPILDGALMVKKGKKIDLVKSIINYDFIKIKKMAMQLKSKYIKNGIGDKSSFINYFKQSNLYFKNDYKEKDISIESLKILNNINVQKVIEARKNNSLSLYNELKKLKYFKILYKEKCCPLFLPVLFETKEKRDFYHKKLIQNDIYCPIHWEIPFEIQHYYKEDIKDIYNKILSLIIDQRYSIEDMHRIIKVFRG
ncbi:MAG: hypothetical protein GX756_06740 [Clostridiales bacterium]|nr:hypothetical protein [Clostridiales bacterium]